LEFANYAIDPGLDEYSPVEGFESKRNTEAALRWADDFGLLGLEYDPVHVSPGGSYHDVSADFLGLAERGAASGRQRNKAHGGPKETIVRFVREAWEAHLVLRLYEAAFPAEPDTEFIEGLMPQDHKRFYPGLTDGEVRRRDWALGMVEDAAHDKVRGHCYPVLYGVPGSYKEGVAFSSLLGAMWLQFLWLMRKEPRQCLWCRHLIPAKARSDAQWCIDNSRCRANWHYHHGDGKSSKHGKKRAREEKRSRNEKRP